MVGESVGEATSGIDATSLDHHSEHALEDDVFASAQARVLAEQLAALVVRHSAPGRIPAEGATTPEGPDSATLPRPPRPRRATSSMVSSERRRAAQAERDRRRRRLLVGTTALGVTLAVLAAAQVVNQVSDRSGMAGETAPDSSVPAEGHGDPAQDLVRCWDGSTAFGVIGCGEPAGLTGLVWVYPSIGSDSCETVGRAGRRRTWTCLVTTRSGSEAQIVYRELASVAKGLAFYTREYGSGLADRKQRSGRYFWRAGDADERGVWQISSMYVDQPWAVHVEADTKKAARQGFATIEFRPVDELRGIQPGG